MKAQTAAQTVEVRADGGDCVSDLGVLAGQEALFGAVAPQSTAHRVIKSIDEPFLDAIRCGKDTGMRAPPFAAFEHNRVWPEPSMLPYAPGTRSPWRPRSHVTIMACNGVGVRMTVAMRISP
ncbi:MAG: hypothetical protein WBM00_03120 [Solirubrobacterales bacterium]